MKFRSRRGQFRILEVIFAAFIIVAAYSVSVFIMAPANIPVIRGKEELEVLGYNLLNTISSSQTLELTVVQGTPNWEEDLKIIITRLLPPGTYFNLTIYNATSSAFGLSQINTKPISNVQAAEAVDAFTRSPEVASAIALYTSSRGWFLVLYLRLAHAGELTQ